jgi:hypothetical protein
MFCKEQEYAAGFYALASASKQGYTVKIAPLASMKGSIKIAAWSLR